MVSIGEFTIEILRRRFATPPFLCIFCRTTRTNNAMRFDFESRTDFLVKGVKNKWSCTQVRLEYARLSSSFIVSRKRIVGSRFRVHVVLTCPPHWAFRPGTRVTPKSFSSRYDSLLYAPRRPPSSVLWNPSSKRARDRYSATCAHARPPLGNGWYTVRGGLGP